MLPVIVSSSLWNKPWQIPKYQILHESSKLSLKQYIRRAFPWLSDLACELRSLLNRETKQSRARLLADISNIHKLVGDRFKSTNLADPDMTVLVFATPGVANAVLSLPILAGFRKAGYRPIILTSDPWPMRRFYKFFGFSDIHSFALYFCDPLDQMAANRMQGIETLREFLDLELDGVRIGKYSGSTLLRKTRQGSLDLKEPRTRKLATSSLAESLGAVEMGKRLIEAFSPDAVLLVDRGYTPFGETFDLVTNDAIPAFTWNVSHRPENIIMKRYTKENAELHPAALSEKTWSQIKAMPWDDKLARRVDDEFTDLYTKGSWFAEVGTQFNVKIMPPDMVRGKLNLDATKKTAFVFAHIFWDATFFWGTDLFQNYEIWLCEILRIAAKNDHLNWVIKVHPANVVKNKRDGIGAVHSEIEAIHETLGTIPNHISVLPPEADISTLSLFPVMDYCLTVRGTIGIEAATRGIRVLTAGTGRYDKLGFTSDFDTSNAFLKAVEDLEDLPEMTSGEIELAQRYAYGVFKVRSIPLNSIDFHFRRDARAELEASIKVESQDALLRSEDVSSLADWVSSGDEDFCRWKIDNGN
jgi:hypothetical protein